MLRSVLLPVHLVKEYLASKNLRPEESQSDFDRTNGVDTDGDFGGWTYLSDLNIPSSNWIEGHDYRAIEPDRFGAVLASLGIVFDEYTFVDYGSGKGRALLLASEFPFKEIIGLEFSPELHRTAQENIGRYHSPSQRCKNIKSIVVDFTEFDLPRGSAVLFFFDPCRGEALKQVVARIERSLIASSSPVYLAYVAPRSETERLLRSSRFLREHSRNNLFNFIVYQKNADISR
jgi:SAM-dependent methyltransferase